MKIYFMLAYSRRVPAPNPGVVGAIENLRARGHEVELGIAEEMVVAPDDLVMDADLYVLKSHTPLWLSLAGILHNRGARLLDPYPGCVASHDKIIASERLRAADIPAPRGWVTGDLARLGHLLSEHSLIIKPRIGGRGAGIHIVHTPRELAALPPLPGEVIVQHYVPGVRDELKVYVIGDAVFGVRKIPDPAVLVRTPAEVPPEIREIALRCGRAFDLSLYGIDVIQGPGGPVVVDVNYFPSYKGVPDASALLADHVARRL